MSADNNRNIDWADGEEDHFENKVKELWDEAYENLYFTFLNKVGSIKIDDEQVYIAEEILFPQMTSGSIYEKIKCMRKYIMNVKGEHFIRSDTITREELLSKYIIIVKYDIDEFGTPKKYFIRMVEVLKYPYIKEREISIEQFNERCDEHTRLIQLEEARLRRRMIIRQRMEEEERQKWLKEEEERQKQEPEESDDSDEEEMIFIHNGDRNCQCERCINRRRDNYDDFEPSKKKRKY